VPQSYHLGVEAQVDWFEALAIPGGVKQKVQMFAMRLPLVRIDALRRIKVPVSLAPQPGRQAAVHVWRRKPINYG
jgi:hypothetical protein